jgi:hypothetical protein
MVGMVVVVVVTVVWKERNVVVFVGRWRELVLEQRQRHHHPRGSIEANFFWN